MNKNAKVNNSLSRNVPNVSCDLKNDTRTVVDLWCRVKETGFVRKNGFRLLVSYDKDLDTNRPWNLKSIIQCYFYCERHVSPSWTACVKVSKYHIEKKRKHVLQCWLHKFQKSLIDFVLVTGSYIQHKYYACSDSLQVYLITTTNMFHYEDNPGAPGLHCGFQGVDWFLILRSYCLCW